MANIEYKIKFFSEWHCGSGLSAGSDVDALAIKDDKGLPFIPGKTIKGLIREAAEDFNGYSDAQIGITEGFGNFNDKGETRQGCMFFSNACLCEEEQQAIISEKLQEHLYRSKPATAIEDNGIAKEHSLRKFQTVVPCELYGKIYNVPEQIEAHLPEILCMIKRIGTNRNRGFGRCDISIVKQ